MISGGSKGLGKSVAILLARQGANLTLLSRTASDLEKTCAEIREFHLHPNPQVSSKQVIQWVTVDVRDALKVSAGIEDAVMKMKDATKGEVGCPESVFTCAGTSLPALFLQQPSDEFKWLMEVNYLGTVHVVQACTKLMIAHNKLADKKIAGRVVMVGSVLGLFGLIGYGAYVPTKFALRGLAEVLMQELKPHNISVHLMFPGTILSPGYEEEQKRKPQITKDIEGADEGQTCEQIAKKLLIGVERGDGFITSDIIGELARCYASGMGPKSSKWWGLGQVVDVVAGAAGAIVFPVWKWIVDRDIQKDFDENSDRYQLKQSS